MVTRKTRPRFFAQKPIFNLPFTLNTFINLFIASIKPKNNQKNQNQHAPKNIHAEKSTLSGKEMEKNI